MFPVFKDMFNLPPETDVQRPSNLWAEPPKLSERSELMELVLQHIDPKTKEPFQEGNVVDLLDFGRKCQITLVTERFVSEVALPQRAVCGTGRGDNDIHRGFYEYSFRFDPSIRAYVRLVVHREPYFARTGCNGAEQSPNFLEQKPVDGSRCTKSSIVCVENV
jgi:hypothetical protein